ncbi:MAG: hypothetical protein ACYDEB_07415 [Dehalococcoidia bacterium]
MTGRARCSPAGVLGAGKLTFFEQTHAAPGLGPARGADGRARPTADARRPDGPSGERTL